MLIPLFKKKCASCGMSFENSRKIEFKNIVTWILSSTFLVIIQRGIAKIYPPIYFKSTVI